MPLCRIKYIAHLAALAGLDAESVELPPSSGLRQLLAELTRRHGPELAGYFIDPQSGDLWPGVAIAVNGHLIASFASAPPLREGDEILLLPGAEGG